MKLPEHEDYFYKNKKIPSVTTIIGLMNKPELIPWANIMGFKRINTTKLLLDSARIGTAVHYTIERLSKSKPTCINIEDEYKKKKVKKAIKSFKLWYKDYKPKILKNEVKLSSKKFGGTMDCICEIDSDVYLIDFKTSKKAYPTYFLQLAGYNLLSKINDYKKIDKVAILVLDKDKVRYDFKIMDIEYLEKYYEPCFKLLLELYLNWEEILYYDWK